MSYACTTADPPWEEKGGGKIKRGADRHYPLLPVPDIIRVMLGHPKWDPATDSHLWLWVTDNFLDVAMSVVMPALGFRFVRTFVWVKESNQGNLQIGLGQYGRGAHELCLFGVRGHGRRLVQNKDVPSVCHAPRTKHSRKPDKFYREHVERVSPGPRLEMFARHSRGRGWHVMGNEVEDLPAAPGWTP